VSESKTEQDKSELNHILAQKSLRLAVNEQEFTRLLNKMR